MINPNSEKKKDEELQTLRSQLEESQSRLLMLKDLQELQNTPLFRQQLLIRLDRIALALENVSFESEDQPIEEEEEVDESPQPTTPKRR